MNRVLFCVVHDVSRVGMGTAVGTRLLQCDIVYLISSDSSHSFSFHTFSFSAEQKEKQSVDTYHSGEHRCRHFSWSCSCIFILTYHCDTITAALQVIDLRPLFPSIEFTSILLKTWPPTRTPSPSKLQLRTASLLRLHNVPTCIPPGTRPLD